VPIEIVMAFLLFRYFDWDKPWPISVVQRRMLTPLGVMLDDVLAAVLTIVFLVAFTPLVHAYFV
jgi:phosphatidylglycerophosphatase A